MLNTDFAHTPVHPLPPERPEANQHHNAPADDVRSNTLEASMTSDRVEHEDPAPSTSWLGRMYSEIEGLTTPAHIAVCLTPRERAVYTTAQLAQNMGILLWANKWTKVIAEWSVTGYMRNAIGSTPRLTIMNGTAMIVLDILKRRAATRTALIRQVFTQNDRQNTPLNIHEMPVPPRPNPPA